MSVKFTWGWERNRCQCCVSINRFCLGEKVDILQRIPHRMQAWAPLLNCPFQVFDSRFVGLRRPKLQSLNFPAWSNSSCCLQAQSVKLLADSHRLTVFDDMERKQKCEHRATSRGKHQTTSQEQNKRTIMKEYASLVLCFHLNRFSKNL